MVLHGGCGTWRLWQLALPLLERDFEVFAVTFPGHGGGPPLATDRFVDIGTLADRIECEMERQDPSPRRR